MVHARPSIAVALAVTFAAVAMFFSLASHADASTHRVRVSSVKSGQMVFKTRVAASKVRAARLKSGHEQRSLKLSTIRRHTRKGNVRVSAPKSLLRKLRRLHTLRHAHAPARQIRAAVVAAQAQAHSITLVLDTATAALAPRSLDTTSCPSIAGGHFVSPSGDDSNPGTIDRPWKTIDKAESTVQPGDTVVLRGGTYGARNHLTDLVANGTGSARINLVAYPGETPVFAGQVAIDGDNRTVCGMLFDGPTGRISSPTSDNPNGEQPKVWIHGRNAVLQNSEVRGAQWHAGVYLEADNATVVGNYIHDNGQFNRPQMANLDHGLYWAKGTGGLIANNRFEHNYAHAVQLYPNVSGVTIRGNTMTGQGRSAILLCESVSSNTVEDNDIYGNQQGIQGYNVTGHDNVARNNRLWNNSQADTSGDGIAFSANVTH